MSGLYKNYLIVILITFSSVAFSDSKLEVESEKNRHTLGFTSENFGGFEIQYTIPKMISNLDLRLNMSFQRLSYGFGSLYLLMFGSDVVHELHNITTSIKHYFNFYAGGGAKLATMTGSNTYENTSSGIGFSIRGFAGASWNLRDIGIFLEPAMSLTTIFGYISLDPAIRLGINYYF